MAGYPEEEGTHNSIQLHSVDGLSGIEELTITCSQAKSIAIRTLNAAELAGVEFSSEFLDALGAFSEWVEWCK